MVAEDRVYALTVVSSKEELLERFSMSSWSLCTAFQLGDLVFANSSRAASGTQEFAVIYDDQQIESLPISRMTPHELSTSLDWLVHGGETFLGVVDLHTEPAAGHTCSMCQ